jgi:sucrose-6-phosphate hydrolase SacC (GH32 family)
MSAHVSFHRRLQNRYRLIGILFLTFCLAFVMGIIAQPVRQAKAASYNYVFTTFLGDGAAQEKLSVYTSSDGANFSLLSNTGYTGPSGVLRDPSIIKHTDGKFYMAYTTQSWTTASTSFGIASSSDLIHWTYLTTITSTIANTHFVWAPEWFQDSNGDVDILVAIDNSGNGSNFRIFKYTATNTSLTAWSSPAVVIGSGNYIDPFVVKLGSTYHLFAKGPTYIETATATSLTGPWTWVGTGNWAGWGSGKEGPALFQLDNGNWRVILDYDLGSHQFVYSDSADGLKTWTPPQQFSGISGVVRHGTVVKVGTATLDDEAYGTQQNQFNYSGSGWLHGACTDCYNSTNSWDNTSNQYVTVTFTGTQIALYGVKDPKHGIGAVSIDGGTETNIDFYAATRAGNQLLWTSPKVPKGPHTFKLRVTGTKNASSSGTWVVPDHVDIIA